MKNRKSVSTLALVALVFVAWACGCPKNLNLNNANNRNNSNNSNNSNNTNSSNNSNRATVPNDFITKFVVSGNDSGVPESTSFGTSDKIYVVFGFKNMPAAKGIKGKLVADAAEDVKPGSSIDVTKETRKGDSSATNQFFFTPKPEWKTGSYHIELLLINDDGTEDILKTQDFTVH